MRGNFSRVSFRAAAGFSGVLKQQGSLELDADANESQAIQLRFLRNLAADLIGQHGAVGDGFKITASGDLPKDFLIGPGRIYVDGWPVDNHGHFAWRGDDDHPGQPWAPEPPEPAAGTYVAYLEVRERHLSAAEHDYMLAPAAPGAMRDVALGGADTASRAQVIWRVVLGAVAAANLPAGPMTDIDWALMQLRWRGSHVRPGTMRVRAGEPALGGADPCVASPRAGYRAFEDRLYRVEICRSGGAGTHAGAATFTWSSSNGSSVIPVESLHGASARLAEGWGNVASGLRPGGHVEISGPAERLEAGPGPIRRVIGYDPDSRTLTLDSAAGIDAASKADGVVVRCWDHVRRKPNTGAPEIADDNALVLTEGTWLTLEDGISIMFGNPPPPPPSPGGPQALVIPGRYRSGDYWLFEARDGLGTVVWPRSDENPPQPLTMPPNGVERHFAPLAAVTFANDGTASLVDLRRVIKHAVLP